MNAEKWLLFWRRHELDEANGALAQAKAEAGEVEALVEQMHESVDAFAEAIVESLRAKKGD